MLVFSFLIYFYLVCKKRRQAVLDWRVVKNSLKIEKKIDKKIYKNKLQKFMIKKLNKNEI